MSSPSTTMKIAMGCFFALFLFMGVGVGIDAFIMGAPLIFVLVPIGIGTVGCLFGVAALKGGMNGTMPSPPSFEIPSSSEMGHVIGQRMTSSGKKIVYQVPAKCPDCGANLSEEGIEWVGPLKARCPYCSATVDAQERTL